MSFIDPPAGHRLPAVASSVQPIPYRAAPPMDAGRLASVLGMTVLLLVVLGVSLWVARRKGWLRRWAIAAGAGHGQDRDARIRARVRLSPATQLFVVDAGDARLMVVESTRHISLQAVETPGQGSADVPR